MFSNKLFLNSTLLYSNYNYNVNIEGEESEDNGFTITSNIEDLSIKEDFEYYINPSNTLRFGVNAIYHTFVPGQFTPGANSNLNDIILQEKFAFESAAYVSEDIKLSEKWSVNTGLRYSWFAQMGPGDIFTYDDDGDIINTETYSSGDVIKTYGGLEPRLGVTRVLNNENSIKASIGRNRQYLHLISNSTSGTPVDLWIPSSNNVKPQISDQFAIGYFQNFEQNTYETFVEVYYKLMQNQVDYKTGAELVFNENVESQLIYGEGKSYGAELFLKKNNGRFKGWISYTWSRTEREFDQVDDGQAYPATWDRTHDLSLVGMYDLSDTWQLSASFAFRSGDARTFPIGKYVVDNKVYNQFGERNRNRLPNYHRLDIGATKKLKKTKNYESSLNISLYNAYGNRNTFALDFGTNKENPTQAEIIRISLFNFIPSITFNFKFK